MQQKSKVEQYLANKDNRPKATPRMGTSVSSYRRDALGTEIANGVFTDGSGTPSVNESNAAFSVGMVKNAQITTGGYGGYQTTGNGGTSIQAPEIYSPLWLNSNLSLPRDRATINAWCRAFFALNGFVHNAISLHSTYPISKLNIKCSNKTVEKFFNEMIDETDLMNVCIQIAQEYWLLGEAFPYAEFDENKGSWSRILLQNPDYIVLNKTVVAGAPSIQLKPDEHLKKIISSNKASDVEQRRNLSQYVVDSIKRGGNIPLSNFNISHLARKISPYSVHGTGLPVCVFRQLMLFDQLRECYDEETEVLTDSGFKKIHDLVELSTELNPNSEYVNGVEVDDNGKVTGVLKLKENVKVACFNPDTEHLEYHVPNELHMSQHNGEMVKFHGKKMDVLVSPNHKMWSKEVKKTDWEKVKASDILNKKVWWKFRSHAKWAGTHIDNVIINSVSVPADLYLEVLGYIISEGHVYSNFENGRYDALIGLTQLAENNEYLPLEKAFKKFANLLDKNCVSDIKLKEAGYSAGKPKKMWSGTIHGKELYNHFFNALSTDNLCTSKFKKIPRWVLDLEPRQLEILLKALLLGDGSTSTSKYGTDSKGYRYYTSSKQLADDVYELTFKLGYSPNIHFSQRIIDGVTVDQYIVLWSTTNYGKEPCVFPGKHKSINKGGGAVAEKINYSGVVWCFEVPTGLFVTRRNGKIAIHGNSKYVQATNMINPLTLVKIGGSGADGFKPTYQQLEEWKNQFAAASSDKDFKIFTHDGVSVEKIGSNSGIFDISGDISQLMKEIFIGLQVPSVLMDGGSDTTYSNGTVALDVLQQRYMAFRNMMSSWLRTKIFAPISKVQEFYEYKDGKKTLIVPDIDWNHMSIFQTQDYVANLVTLSGGEGENKRVSNDTLYRSLGLNFDDEKRKMRKEAIQNEIAKKEKASLANMSLNDLRTLDEDDEIEEVEGAEGSNNNGNGGGLGGEPGGLSMPDGNIPGLDLGGGDMGLGGAMESAPEGGSQPV